MKKEITCIDGVAGIICVDLPKMILGGEIMAKGKGKDKGCGC